MLRDPQRPFSAPDDATEILLVRHGSAGGFASGEPPELVGGHTDPPLSALGHAQARALTARLASTPISGIFVTTLRRTAETAAPLAASTGLEPVVVGDLREVFLGDWEGGEFAVRMKRGDPAMVEVFARQRWDVIPNAEPAERFAARVRGGLDEVASATGPGGVAVAIVHGGVVAEACRQATGSEPFAFINVENASITRLIRLATGRWVLLSFNDTAHLAQLGDEAPAVGSLDNAA